MPVLEVRRHTMRTKPGAHLSQEGVTLARRVGEGMGPFDRVITSTLPRAFETAIAMGFAVDEQVDWLVPPSDAVDEQLAYPASFAEYTEAVHQAGAVSEFAKAQANYWGRIVRQLPDRGAALLISHGGVMEIGAVGCMIRDSVEVPLASWGGALDYCEGVRLHFTGDRCTGGEVLRISMMNGGGDARGT